MAKLSIKDFSWLHIPLWLGIVLIAIVIFRIPTLFEPYHYGDEMIYLSLGRAVNHGLVLYKDIFDHKPPLLYLLAAFSQGLFWFRAVLLVWMLATTILFWKLSIRIFTKNKRIGMVATIIFAILTTLPLLEGNIPNAEIFMIGLSIIGFLFLLKEKVTTRDLIFGGMAFSLAVLFKIPAVFDIPVVFIYWLLINKFSKNNLMDMFKKASIVGIAFLIPILLSFIWYAIRGALPAYIDTAFIKNIWYVSSWGGESSSGPSPLIIRAGILLLGLIILWVFRKKLSKGFILSCVWLLFTLFAATLSQRPYPHYLIQAVPPISLLIGVLIASTRLEQVWTIIPLALVVAIPVYYKFYQYDSVSYYANFVQFVTGQKDKWQYFNQFNSSAERNYKIARFLKDSSLRDDKIFVWGGDSSTIYALSDRLPPINFVTDFHIKDFYTPDQAMAELESDMPRFVVMLPNHQEFLALDTLLRENYLLIQDIDGAEIWYRKQNETLKTRN